MFKRIFALGMIILVFGTTVAAAQLDANAECASPAFMTPRLAGGMKARVIRSEPVNVYMDFNTASEIVGQVEPGAVIPINTAPRCEDGTVWWQSNFRAPNGPDDTPFGWLPESIDGAYVLEPYLQELSLPEQSQPITVINVASIEQVAQLEYGAVSGVVWSADSTQVAVNTVGAVWIHDLPGNSPVRVTPNNLNTNLTSNINFSADGNLLATAGTGAAGTEANPLFVLWSTEDGSTQLRFEPEQADYGRYAAISPDFSMLATVQWDGVITLWNLSDGTIRSTLEGHELVGAVQFSPDGQTLVSLGGGGMMASDTTLRIWDVASGTQRGVIDLGSNTLNLAFSPDSQLLAVPAPVTDGTDNLNGGLWVINTATTEVRYQVPLETGFGDVSFNGDGTLLAASSAYFDDERQGWAGSVTFFDAATGNQVYDLTLELNLSHIAFSPDSQTLVIVHADPDFWGPDRVTFWRVP